MEKKLQRSNNKILAGVCGGLAEYSGFDATILRILYVVLTFCTGIGLGLIAYLVLALLMPKAE